MAVVATNPDGGCDQYGKFFTRSVQAAMSLVREIDDYN